MHRPDALFRGPSAYTRRSIKGTQCINQMVYLGDPVHRPENRWSDQIREQMVKLRRPMHWVPALRPSKSV